MWVAAILSFYISCAQAAPSTPSPEKLVYHIDFQSRGITPQALTQDLKKIGALKAGEAELGSKVNGQDYFHFNLPKERVEELWPLLFPRGRVEIHRVYGEKTTAPSQIRFILWMSPLHTKGRQTLKVSYKAPKGTWGKGPRWIFETTEAAPQKFPALLHLARLEVFESILKNLDLAPYQIHHSSDDKSSKVKTPVTVHLETLDSAFAPSLADKNSRVEVQLPHSSSEPPDSFLERLAAINPKVSWQLENHTYDWFFYARLTRAQAAEVLSQISTRNDFSISTHGQFNANSSEIPLELRLPKLDFVLESIKKYKSPPVAAPPPTPVAAEVLEREQEKLPGRSYRRGGEVHAFGSLVPAENHIAIVGDLYGLLWIENFGVKLHGISSSSKDPIYNFVADDLSLHLRFPFEGKTFQQSLSVSIHHKQMHRNHQITPLYGLGLSYHNDIWSWVDQLLNWLPGFHYPKTVEAYFEYLPLSPSSRVEDIQAWVATLKAYMFLSRAFSVEAGFYFHDFNYTITQQDRTTMEYMFAEVGVGYRF